MNYYSGNRDKEATTYTNTGTEKGFAVFFHLLPDSHNLTGNSILLLQTEKSMHTVSLQIYLDMGEVTA